MTVREIADLFAQLELHLIASLKRNLTRHRRQEEDEGGTGGVPERWEAWQSAKLRDIRRFRRENRAILGEYQTVIDEETEALIREQYGEGGSRGFFHTSDDRLRALIDEMQGNAWRAERATLRYMDDVYRKSILRTATAMTAGGMTLQQATDEATREFLEQGINCIRYSNGRQVNIASYAEMALRTCATRAMLLGEARQRQRMGINTVLVSQYGACSDTCLPWQGKVYVDDVFQEYHGAAGGSFAVSLQGRQYLRLSVAIKAGLFHPNCRHTITTWIEGVSRMPEPMDPAQIERTSKLEQTQRRMELEVRKAKRLASGLSDPEAVKEANRHVRARQKLLREFVAEHGDVLRRDYWRERDTGVPEGGGVTENSVANSANSGTIGVRRVGIQFFAKIPDEKFTAYCLNPEKAPDKAKAFQSALGYNLSNFNDLIENINRHIDESKFVEKGDKGHGMLYEYVIELTGPNGKTANVLTAWIDDNGEKRLTSAYVTKKKVTE